MRLTLRTLLAYLDNVLDPKDAKDLAGKVQESQFASALVERIQNCVRRSRLSAPSPLAEGPTNDANLTAEYLDSQLSEDGVARVERLCLESDVHLAEVAASHQVLSLVLRMPAEVPPELRERIYALDDVTRRPSPTGEGPEAATAVADTVAAAVAGTSAVPVEPTTAGRAKGPEPAYAGSGPADRSLRVPDYLHDSGWRRMTSVVVTALLCVVFLFALAQTLQPLGRLSQADPQPTDEEIAAAAAADDAVEPAPGAASRPPRTAQPRTAQSDPAAAARPPRRQAEASGPGGTRRGAETEPSTAPANAGEQSDRTPTQRSPEPPVPETDPGEAPAPPLPADEPPAPRAGGGDTAASDSEPVPATPEEPASADPVARVASDGGLLLALEGPQPTWVRKAPEAAIEAGTVLVNAPLYRSRITLAEQIDLMLVGGGRVQIAPGGDEAAVTLEMDNGQALLAAHTPGARVHLQMAGREGILELEALESVVAIRASHLRAPGYDPAEPGISQPAGMLLAVQGAVSWQSEAEEADQRLTTGQQLRWVAEEPGAVSTASEIPAWIDPPDPRVMTIEAAARQGLLPLVPPDQPAEKLLREATQFRQSDVAALAARTLLYLDMPDVYFGVDGILNRPDQRAYWPQHVAELFAAAGRGPQSAQRLRRAIERMNGAEADTLYRLLWGYSDQQLEAGADAELVDLLNSPVMSVRVLALENLRQITGQTLHFRADQDNPTRRAAAAKTWQSRLRRGDIRWPAAQAGGEPAAASGEDGEEAPAPERGAAPGADVVEIVPEET